MSRQPESELLMTAGKFELRFTPNLTRIFVRDTETGVNSFPKIAVNGRNAGGKDNVHYPEDMKVPIGIHRQVVRILKARPNFSFGWVKLRKKMVKELEII